MPQAERIYIAASTHDARFTRICVASVRRFHPDVPVTLLAGGALQPGLAGELRRHWDVEPVPMAGEYGWGFVKLEPLFGRAGSTFLILDSDTVLTGPVLDKWRFFSAPFLVDDEAQAESAARSLYYDWDALRAMDPRTLPPTFVFNSGQWFGTAGVLTRSDFDQWVAWSMPRMLRYPECFMPGDQGVLNYVLNQKVRLQGLRVERQVLMRWPANGMQGLEAATVARGAAPALIVHWAGLKRMRQRDMPGSDLLAYFEQEYYDRLPGGGLRRPADIGRHALAHWRRQATTRLTLAARGARAAVKARA